MTDIEDKEQELAAFQVFMEVQEKADLKQQQFNRDYLEKLKAELADLKAKAGP